MPIYYPLFEEVFVFRNIEDPERYVTMVVRGATEAPREVTIDGQSYEYDEDGTEKTRMHMRVNATRRAEGEQQQQ